LGAPVDPALFRAGKVCPRAGMEPPLPPVLPSIPVQNNIAKRLDFSAQML